MRRLNFQQYPQLRNMLSELNIEEKALLQFPEEQLDSLLTHLFIQHAVLQQEDVRHNAQVYSTAGYAGRVSLLVQGLNVNNKLTQRLGN